MSRKRRTGEQEPLSLELTPMIDIVFNLLVFFMVATRFKSTEGLIKAFLPQDRGPGSAPAIVDLGEARILVLWHDAAGRPSEGAQGHCVVKLGDEELNLPGELEGTDHPERLELWPRLQERLRALQAAYRGASGDGLPVIIDSRPQVPTRVVVLVLNEVVRAGIRDLTFAAPEAP